VKLKNPQLLAAALIGVLAITGVSSAQAQSDKQTVTDAYVYVPKDLVKRGEWFPPAIKRVT